MKIVLNRAYGGFGYGVDDKYDELIEKYEHDRTAEELVKAVEENPEEFEDLEVVWFEDEATDYMIEEYDGAETLVYVLNGKLRPL